MGKKRRIPAGKVPDNFQRTARTLDNELLSLALGQGANEPAPMRNRLRQRHPELTPAQADEVVRRCQAALAASYAIVARTITEGEDRPQASGRILAAFPWIDTDNLERLCWRCFYLAK